MFQDRFPAFSRHLGTATSNVGELNAILDAATHTTQTLSSHPPQICIVSDSSYAINAVEGKSRIRKNAALIADVVRAVDRLKDLTSTVILKCPGHAKVALNCMADWTAKRGARGITSDSPLPADVVSQILRGEEVEDFPVVLPGRLRLSPLTVMTPIWTMLIVSCLLTRLCWTLIATITLCVL